MDMIRQSVKGVCSTEASLQIPSEHLQPYQKFFEDLDNANIVPDHEVELVDFEHQEIGHIYHDPITSYMEEFFFSEYPLVPKVSGLVHGPRVLCCKDQVGIQHIFPMQVIFLIWMQNIKRAELLEKLLDWLHWHYCII
jgi:hypothetical protein